jgi:RecB family endonuclease NucS
MMKKSNRKELNWEQTEKLVTLALEENPLKLLKRIWPGRKEVLEIMKKKMRQI